MSSYFNTKDLLPNIFSLAYPFNLTFVTFHTARNVLSFTFRTYLQHRIPFRNDKYDLTKTFMTVHYRSISSLLFLTIDTS
ncbi:34438_t:CDS:1, partial [Racocetra persica]